MSCSRAVKTFEVVEIKLDEITETDLIELENKVHSAIFQKLEKLNILIKDMNVYSYNGCLLINDRYKICSDFEEIASAFGLDVNKINCNLRGNNFIVSDVLISLLKEIGVDCAFGENIANQPLSEEIKAIIENNVSLKTTNEDFLAIIHNIRKNGRYTMTKQREVITSYYDDQFRGEKKGDWDFNEKTVQELLKNFAKRSEQLVNQANMDMLNGTTKLIYSRARQMGYSVEQVKRGKEVQLVLVRLQ